MNANVSNGPLSVEIDGAGVYGDYGPVVLSTHNLTFTSLGQVQAVTVTNQGSSPAPIYYTSITNNAKSFSYTTDCSSSLAGGATCTIYLSATLTALQGEFSPSTTGSFLLTGNLVNGPQTVYLSDNTTGRTHLCGYVGPVMGSTGVGTTLGGLYLGFEKLTATDTFTASLDPTTNGGFSAVVTSSPDTAGCDSTESTIYAITFAPSSAGPKTGTVDTSRGTIILSGTGRDVPAAEPTQPTTTIDLSQSAVGAAVNSHLTIRNTGSLALNFKATITGPNASDFTASGCQSVAVAAQCDVTVTFTPLGSGTRTATLTLTDQANNVVLQYPLTGQGVVGPPMLSVAALNFPATAVGSTSAEMTLTVTSTTGASVSVKDRSYDPFTVRQIGCTGVVCTYGVKFTAPDYGIYDGLLTAKDSLTGALTTIPLHGAGGDQSITIGDGSGHLHLPDTAVGDSVTVKVYVTNTGTAQWSIQDFGLANTSTDSSGSSLYAFSTNIPANPAPDVACGYGAQLDPGTSCFYNIIFTPQATGTETGRLDIYTNLNGNNMFSLLLDGAAHN